MALIPTRPTPVDTKPYLSVALARSTRMIDDAELLGQLVAEAEAWIEARGKRTGEEMFQPEISEGGAALQAFAYLFSKQAAWASEAAFTDTMHELLVIAVKDTKVAVCCTEAGVRDGLVNNLAGLVRFTRSEVEQTFVGKQAKALWLKGIHTPTAAKADAKALLGRALELAIDPLGDQSYFYSAVKSHVPFGGAESLIGTAPGSARVWIGRKSWTDFAVALNNIFDALAAPAGGAPHGWLDILATESGSIDDAGALYAIAIVPPELLGDVEIDAADREKAIAWAYAATFDILETDDPHPVVAVALDGTGLGTLRLDFGNEASAIKAEATWLEEGPGSDVDRAACKQMLEDTRYLRAYFEGATLAEGRLFNPAYRDEKFAWEFADFTGYAITDEKPARWGNHSLAALIAEKKENGDDDDSLFAYVVEKLFPKGWLASDDGAMEFADFVHIDPESHRVTLIHAKGSNKDNPGRGVSVSSYEVVVGQAVKNVRYLDRDNLARILENGVNKAIAGAVWFDGARQDDRAGIIAMANQLKPDHEKVVMVLQPQLTRSERDACDGGIGGPRGARMRQLHTLMLAAELSCRAVGARLVSIGSE